MNYSHYKPVLVACCYLNLCQELLSICFRDYLIYLIHLLKCGSLSFSTYLGVYNCFLETIFQPLFITIQPNMPSYFSYLGSNGGCYIHVDPCDKVLFWLSSLLLGLGYGCWKWIHIHVLDL